MTRKKIRKVGNWRIGVISSFGLCAPPQGCSGPVVPRPETQKQAEVSRSAPARKGLFGMAKNIYVGNLAWTANQDDLYQLFSQYGKVTRAQVISDRETGRSRGFGFVEMESDDEAQRAIDALNGATHDSRQLTVNEARPREDRPMGGGGGGGGGPRNGGGGGGYGGSRPGGRSSYGSDRGRRY